MREKELRLALICYGGVSLAVYMHGITREIWHLIRASKAHLEHGPAGTGSEIAYRELLELIQAKSGTRMRVLTDIVSGASAGGINGVFLSQAIVTGQSLEPLTDMWLKNADVEVLLDPDARPLSRFTKFWAAPIAWTILRRRGGPVQMTVAKEARDEVATKLSSFVRARVGSSLLLVAACFPTCCSTRWMRWRRAGRKLRCYPPVNRSTFLSPSLTFMAIKNG